MRGKQSPLAVADAATGHWLWRRGGRGAAQAIAQPRPGTLQPGRLVAIAAFDDPFHGLGTGALHIHLRNRESPRQGVDHPRFLRGALQVELLPLRRRGGAFQLQFHLRQRRQRAGDRHQAQIARALFQRDAPLLQTLAVVVKRHHRGVGCEHAPVTQIVAAFHAQLRLHRRGAIPVEPQRAWRLTHTVGIHQPARAGTVARGRACRHPAFEPAHRTGRIALGNQLQVAPGRFGTGRQRKHRYALPPWRRLRRYFRG